MVQVNIPCTLDTRSGSAKQCRNYGADERDVLDQGVFNLHTCALGIDRSLLDIKMSILYL